MLALRNSKIIAVSQMMDIHMSSLLSKLKENQLFEPSIQLDNQRKEINENIKQMAFFRWKLMHATGSGAKMSSEQIQESIEQLRHEGKMIIDGSKLILINQYLNFSRVRK